MGTSYLQMRVWTLFPPEEKETLFRNLAKEKRAVRKLPYHPLLEPLITEKVFAFLDEKGIYPLRLVCKQWNSQACDYLHRRSMPVKVRTDARAQHLSKLCQGSDRFPVSNFDLKIQKSSRIFMTKFFETLQETITTLQVTVASADFPILTLNLKSLKNLKSLTIHRQPEESLQSVFTMRDFPVPHSSNQDSKATLYNLETLILKNNNPKKRLVCDYMSFILSFCKSASKLKHLEFYHWTTPMTKLFEKVTTLDKLQSLVIQGRRLGHKDVLLLSRVRFDRIKILEIMVDNRVDQECIRTLVDSLPTNMKSCKLA